MQRTQPPTSYCIMTVYQIAYFVAYDNEQDACSGVHSACREENRHKVGIYVQLLDQAGNTKSGYLRIFNVLTRVITRDLTTEFFLK